MRVRKSKLYSICIVENAQIQQKIIIHFENVRKTGKKETIAVRLNADSSVLCPHNLH